MDIDDLYRALAEEKRSQVLRDLPEGFYGEVAAYMEELQKSLEGEEEGREFLEDEWKSAHRVVVDLVDLRLGKMSQRALYGARGLAPEGAGGVLAEERGAMGRFQVAAHEERARLLQSLRIEVRGEKPRRSGARGAGRKGGPTGGETPPMKETPQEAPRAAADAEKAAGGGEGKDISGSGQLTLVRVVQDLPPFVGADGRTYRLKSEDLVMLPKTNVDSLVKRGAAVPLAPAGR